eukprot:scaffold155266_cov21-Tisochrysis_lutea.AAC.4
MQSDEKRIASKRGRGDQKKNAVRLKGKEYSMQAVGEGPCQDSQNHRQLHPSQVFHAWRNIGNLNTTAIPHARHRLPECGSWIAAWQVGDSISPTLLAQCEDLGILVDKDDQGVLLQIFTKPLGAHALYHSAAAT